MAAAQEYEPFMEEGLPPAAQPAPPRVRLAPRLALAAGLLALWGCAAALALRPRAPGVRVPGVQAPADVPLVSFAADGGFASDDLLEEEVNAPTEAIGRWEWDAEGATNCVSVVKGARYWVEDRRDSGWTYVRAFDYSEQGWAPDSALYHGEPTIVRKEYSANGFRVIPGDSVWVLDRKPNPSGGPDWCYVLFGDKEAWISEKAIHENDLIHPVACFVKEAYEAQDVAHLTIKKGEVVWANIADSTVPWVLVENDKKETGWVPRKHLIESRPLPVLQTFNADSKVDDSLPSPLLYVNEGDTVWVEDGQSQPGWIYSYIHNEEGYVPEWALMQVKVDGESEDQVSSKEEEGTTPGDEAPEEVEGGEGETPSEGKVEEATDAVSRSTPAPAEKKEEPAPEGNETVPAPAPAPVDDKEEPAPEGDEPVPAPAPAPDKDKEEPEDSDEPAPAPEPAPADDKEEPEDDDEPAPAPKPAPADDKEEPEDSDEPAPAPKPAPADDKEEPEDSDEPAPAPKPAPADDKEEPEDDDEPAPAPEPAPAEDKEEPEGSDEPAPAPKPAPAEDKEEPEDDDEPAPAPEPAPAEDKEEPEDDDEPAPAPEPAPAEDKEEPEDDDEPEPAPEPAPSEDKEEPEDSDEPAPAPEPAPAEDKEEPAPAPSPSREAAKHLMHPGKEGS